MVFILIGRPIGGDGYGSGKVYNQAADPLGMAGTRGGISMLPYGRKDSRHSVILCKFCLTLVTFSMVLCADEPKQQTLPDGPGKETTARVCGACHGVEVATSHRDTRDGWNAIVADMVQRGAKGTDEEFGQIVDYLAEHFPKASPAKSSSEKRLKIVAGLKVRIATFASTRN